MSILSLKEVTLYKNELAYLEYAGRASSASLEIAASVKQLVLSTLCVRSEVPFAITSKDTGTSSDRTGETDSRLHSFQYGTNKNIGSFLGSLIGASVRLTADDPGPSYLSLSYLFFYINTLVGCASIGLKSKVAGTV